MLNICKFIYLLYLRECTCGGRGRGRGIERILSRFQSSMTPGLLTELKSRVGH